MSTLLTMHFICCHPISHIVPSEILYVRQLTVNASVERLLLLSRYKIYFSALSAKKLLTFSAKQKTQPNHKKSGQSRNKENAQLLGRIQ